MSSSFDALSPSYQDPRLPSNQTLHPLSDRVPDSPLPRRSRSPNFLASVKGLVHRSRSPLRPRTSNGEIYITPPIQESYTAPHRPVIPLASNEPHSLRSSGQKRRKRREQIPSMTDYLTLSQLENVWQRQDTYKGCVDAPQRAPQQSAISPRQRTETNLETPFINIHPAQRRYRSHDSWARSRCTAPQLR